jgi:protease-4
LNWLLDERYHILIAGMAEGRHKSQEEMKQLIDRAPLFAEGALTAGLVDYLAYEDELATLLAETEADEEKEKEEANEEPAAAEPEEESETEETVMANPGPTAEEVEEKGPNEEELKEKERPQAKLLTWDKAHPLLMEKARRRHKKFIGVVSLEGAIAMGPSRQPPIDLPIPLIGGAVAGEETLVRLLRRAEQMDDMAALIFHVDSGGGSAVASDLIGRQIKRISRQKPVLVYMGDVAASGGYYVSAPARYIMSQSGTTTGSIGVIMGRISTRGLYQKIKVNRVSLKRGQHADLYSDDAPMTEEEREIFWGGIVDVYQKFKQVVAEGRDLPLGELDPVSEGRVWSGRQALERNLVDGHGDFVDAVRKAAELADLPTDDEHVIPVVNLYPKSDGYLPPRPFEANETVAEIGRLLVGERWRELNGRPLLLMPFEFRFR